MSTAAKMPAHQGNVGKSGDPSGVLGQEGSQVAVKSHHLPNIYRDGGEGNGNSGGGEAGTQNNEQLVALLAGAHTGQLKVAAKNLAKPKQQGPKGHESLLSHAGSDGSSRVTPFQAHRKNYGHGARFGADAGAKTLIVPGTPFNAGSNIVAANDNHWTDQTLSAVTGDGKKRGDLISRVQRDIRNLPPNERSSANDAAMQLAALRRNRGRPNTPKASNDESFRMVA